MNEIAALRAQLADLAGRAKESAIAGQIANAVDASGIKLAPGAAGQVVQLIRPTVVEANAGGTTVLAGPGLRPLADHVRDTLQSEAFRHFHAGAGSAGPAAGRPVGTQGQLAAVLGQCAGAAAEMVPAGHSLGHQLLGASRAAQQAAGGDPRVNPGLSMIRGMIRGVK